MREFIDVINTTNVLSISISSSFLHLSQIIPLMRFWRKSRDAFFRDTILDIRDRIYQKNHVIEYLERWSFSLSSAPSHSLLTRSGLIASRPRKKITNSASFWIAFVVWTLMSLLSGACTVYPRGFLFGQVRADRPDKDRALARWLWLTNTLRECLHGQSPQSLTTRLLTGETARL